VGHCIQSRRVREHCHDPHGAVPGSAKKPV
jgi:hypothetical protein